MLKIILIGKPGCGKGTLSHSLRTLFNFKTFSTGDALREEIRRGTEKGRIIASLIEKGHFAPLKLVMEVTEAAILNSSSHLILDGFPRDLEQGRGLEEVLEKSGQKIDAVIYLDISEDNLKERISKRSICSDCGRSYNEGQFAPVSKGECDDCKTQLSKRKDDAPEFLEERLRIYEKSTMPLLQFYREKGILYEVDSNLGAENVLAQVSSLIKNLNKKREF